MGTTTTNIVALVKELDPVGIVALISIVALLVVAYCVRQFCKTLSRRRDD